MQVPTGFEESNEHYLALRLQYKEDQPRSWRAFSTVGSVEMLGTVTTAWVRGLIFATVVTPIAFIAIFAAGGAGLAIALLLWFAAWILPWFIPDHVYAGHWELALENQGHLVEPAFALTAQRLQQKGLGAKVEPRRVKSTVAGSSRFYLTVKQDRYTCYVAILSYGTDLFASWSMWREQRPLAVLWYWLVGIARSLIGKSSQFHEVVRADPARAMREAVHNAARSGVEAAIEGQQATIVGTFGSDLSIENIGPHSSAPPTLDLTAQYDSGSLPPPPGPLPSSNPAGAPPLANDGSPDSYHP